MSDNPAGGGAEAGDDGEFFYESEQVADTRSWLRAEYGVAPTAVPWHAPNASLDRARPQKDACLIMYHIPKCGGTSLTRFFNDNGIKLWTHYRTLDPARPPPFSDQPGVVNPTPILGADVYMGHWTPDFKHILRDRFNMTRNCYEATVLRHPYERVASALFYHHTTFSQEQMIRLMKLGPIRETIEYYDDECRHFGSAESYQWDTYSGAYKNDDLAKASCDVSVAMRRLSELDFVFSTHNYQRILDAVGALFGLKDIEPPPTMNRSKNPGFKELRPELQSLISSANGKDMEMFAAASESLMAASAGNTTA